jgi:hypothetical protein
MYLWIPYKESAYISADRFFLRSYSGSRICMTAAAWQHSLHEGGYRTMKTKQYTDRKYKDHQMELGYIIYMIVGSYFGRTRCRTRNMEQKMETYYRLMRPAEQISKEEDCICFAEENLLEQMPAEFLQSHVDAFLTRDPRDGKACVIFTDGFERIEVTADSIRGEGIFQARRRFAH